MDRTEKAAEQLGFQSWPWFSLDAEISFLMEGVIKKAIKSQFLNHKYHSYVLVVNYSKQLKLHLYMPAPTKNLNKTTNLPLHPPLFYFPSNEKSWSRKAYSK